MHQGIENVFHAYLFLLYSVRHEFIERVELSHLRPFTGQRFVIRTVRRGKGLKRLRSPSETRAVRNYSEAIERDCAVIGLCPFEKEGFIRYVNVPKRAVSLLQGP